MYLLVAPEKMLVAYEWRLGHQTKSAREKCGGRVAACMSLLPPGASQQVVLGNALNQGVWFETMGPTYPLNLSPTKKSIYANIARTAGAILKQYRQLEHLAELYTQVFLEPAKI